jgi:hypothetical protein
VTITPAGDNNVVDIIEGATRTFTCTTDSSRPAAWIQWYNYYYLYYLYHCIQAAGRLESVVHVNVCVSPSIISTALFSPAGVIVTVVTGTGR